jgi:UDP-N-acetylmuramoylalanine--D-glutamate ligase
VILNLGVDHIDRHGTVRDYHLAKKNLLNNLTAEDTFVYNADDPKLAAWAKETPAKALGFSSSVPQPVSDTDTIAPAVDVGRYPAYQYEGRLWLEQHPLIDTRDLRIQGSHQYHNALAVALVGHACGVEKDSIKQGLQAFTGVPGRYAHVAEIAGVRFVEDSIATRTLAVKAALEATPAPIVWLAGGQDKGAETESLRELVRDKVVLVVGIGEAGSTFVNAFAAVTNVRVCEEADGEKALAQACQWGLEMLLERAERAETSDIPTLGTVLLAPLAASFDQFADYHARAQAFRRVVAALAQLERARALQDVSNKEASWTVS